MFQKIRKRLFKTKFTPGVLKRAYRKQAPTFKVLMVEHNTYYYECLHKLYPDKIRARTELGIKLALSRSALVFATDLKRLIEKIHPQKLDEEPSEQHIDLVREWARTTSYTPKGVRLSRTGAWSLCQRLKPIGLHEDYLSAIIDNSYSKDDEQLYERFKIVLHSLLEITSRREYFRMFLNNLDVLKSLNGVDDLSKCGDLSIQDASEFCLSRCKCEDGGLYRAALVLVTGFRHGKEQLVAQLASEVNIRKRYSAIFSGARCKGNRFHQLLKLYRALSMNFCDLVDASPEMLRERLEQHIQSDHQAVFKLLEVELECLNLSSTLATLREIMEPPFVTRSNWQFMSSHSQWHKDILEKILKEVTYGRTWFKEKRIEERRIEIGALTMFIRTYATEHFGDRIQDDIEPFKWFLDNCDHAMVKNVIIAYGSTRTHNRERVRSAADVHNAGSAVAQMLGLFKNGLNDVLAHCRLELLSQAKILRCVENKRVPADPMVRRTYREEELDSMEDVCRFDSERHLLLILLREIGLRVNALCHIRYRDLVDENHLPREQCQVYEKARTIRRFITSDKLKAAIARHCESLRTLELAEGVVLGDLYVFAGAASRVKPQKYFSPTGTVTLRRWLKEIAELAGVSGVKIHPHAFRHTIVGQLIDAGNSMEIVSKYMGHKSVDTTSNHYWVADIQDIHDKMNNPFTGTYQENVREQETKDLEVEFLRMKVQKSMEIIHKYNTIIGPLAQTGGSAADVQRQIFQSMPNLGEILRIINGDESESENEEPEEETSPTFPVS